MRIFLILVLFSAACGATNEFSCQAPGAMSCTEYTGTWRAGIEARAASCKSPAQWVETLCPTANRVGGCRQGDDRLNFTTWYYDTHGETWLSLRLDCASGLHVYP